MAVSIEARPSEYDASFRVTCIEGACLGIKVMHSSRSTAVMDMQLKAMSQVASRCPQLAVPITLQTKEGAPFVRIFLSLNTPHFLCVYKWLDGKPFAVASPRTEPLWTSLGEAIGSLSLGLEGFTHPEAKRDNRWDLLKGRWIRDRISAVADGSRRSLVMRAIDEFETHVVPAERNNHLRYNVIHGCPHDYNVVTMAVWGSHPRVTGLLDFGDLHEGIVVGDLAVAIAHGIAGAAAPLDAARAIVRGYASRTITLTLAEIEVLWPLVAMHLAVFVVASALRRHASPNDNHPLNAVSDLPAWDSLALMQNVPAAVAAAALREAAGLEEPSVGGKNIHDRSIQAMCESDSTQGPSLLDGVTFARVIDTYGEGEISPDDASAAFDWSSLPGVGAGGGAGGSPRRTAARVVHCARFCAVRPVPPSTLTPGLEPSHCLLGLGLLLAPGDAVLTPRAVTIDAIILPTPGHHSALLLRHKAVVGQGGHDVWALWSGLELDNRLCIGAQLSSGLRIGFAPWSGRGIVVSAWAGTSAGAIALRAPLWVRASDAPAWRAAGACDPARLIRFPVPRPRVTGGPTAPLSTAAAFCARAAVFGTKVPLAYTPPVRAVRGEGCYLVDVHGVAYIDADISAPSVGHAHPRVAKAVAAATARLQTNTRYLNDAVLTYACLLLATVPAPLSVVFFTADACEANELALRIARAATGREDVICHENSYHGTTKTLDDISHTHFGGMGGGGVGVSALRFPKSTHVAPAPDVYRGLFRRDDAKAGEKYAAAGVGAILSKGVRPAAFIAESFHSGLMEFPTGYLSTVYGAVRRAGGVCIADEMQSGFGSLGPDAFWAFQTQNVVPDILTLGRSLGNGFPMGAVITTRALVAAFDNGMEYFCTGGGGPCAAAAGMAVLDVLALERLPESAMAVGGRLRARLSKLSDSFDLVGDVRGSGLFLGIEIVRNREMLEEGGEEAAYIVNRLRENGILCGRAGLKGSVITIAPPLCFTDDHAAFLYDKFVEILLEDGLSLETRPSFADSKQQHCNIPTTMTTGGEGGTAEATAEVEERADSAKRVAEAVSSPVMAPASKFSKISPRCAKSMTSQLTTLVTTPTVLATLTIAAGVSVIFTLQFARRAATNAK